MSNGGVVPVFLDEETDLHYIRGNNCVLFENGVKVDRLAFDTRHTSKRTVTDLITESRKSPTNCDWDFKHAIKTQKLIRTSGGKKMPTEPKVQVSGKPVSEAEKIRQVAAPAADTIKKLMAGVGSAVKSIKLPTKLPETKRSLSAPYTDVIVMLVVVATMCVVMSIYHTRLFLIDSGKMPWVATTASISMVIFSSSAYTAARHVWGDKAIALIPRAVFSLFLVVTGTAVIFYSVFSTTNVSFDQYRSKHSETVKAAVTDSTKVTINDDKIKNKDKEISDIEAKIFRYESESNKFYADMTKPLPTISTSEDPVQQEVSRKQYQAASTERSAATRGYNRLQPLIDEAYKEKAKALEARNALLTEREVAITSAESSVSTAYTMVAKYLRLSEDTLRFIVYVIPAAFFDIVAPFAVAIVLLLKDRRKELEVKE